MNYSIIPNVIIDEKILSTINNNITNILRFDMEKYFTSIVDMNYIGFTYIGYIGIIYNMSDESIKRENTIPIINLSNGKYLDYEQPKAAQTTVEQIKDEQLKAEQLKAKQPNVKKSTGIIPDFLNFKYLWLS